MPSTLRLLVVVWSICLTIGLAGCSDATESDPTPTVTQPKAYDVEGSFAPKTALTKITATPTSGGGTAITATMVTPGVFVFKALPIGTYTVQYTPAAGYTAPVPYFLQVLANNSAGIVTIPELFVLTPRETLLTAVKWLPIRNTTYNKTTGTTEDNFATLSACVLDNYLQFMADKTMFLDEGPTKCAPTDPQQTKYLWTLENNETHFRFTNSRGSGIIENDIVYLTDKGLQTRGTYIYQNQEFEQTITYTAF